MTKNALSAVNGFEILPYLDRAEEAPEAKQAREAKQDGEDGKKLNGLADGAAGPLTHNYVSSDVPTNGHRKDFDSCLTQPCAVFVAETTKAA